MTGKIVHYTRLLFFSPFGHRMSITIFKLKEKENIVIRKALFRLV